MNQLYKYLIAIAVGAILTAFVTCKKDNDIISETIVTKTDTVTVVRVDSIPFKIIDTVFVKSKPVVINVPRENPMGGEPVYREVETTKYTGKEELENGTIDYEIYADSLYATSFKLTTEDRTINNTTTITKVVPTKSRLFFVGGGEMGWNDQYPKAASVGLMYNRRQKWGIGVDVRQDFTGLMPVNERTTVGLKIYIGL